MREGRDHLELAGEAIDMERGARLSGSRFAYLRGAARDARVRARALGAREARAATASSPSIPPVLVREQALYGTGFLPDTEQQIYRLADDDLYLVGTSEVALASLHAGEILDEAELPRRYAGFSPCFRREAGAAGRDTRGIFRVHQFDKVEMFVFCDAGARRSAEHERLLAIEEEILQELEIPYRVVNIAVDDLGSSAAKKYDCEAWLPGQGRYRELTSTSNTTDYQARRLEIRYRARGRRAARGRCTRSTAPPSPSAGRSSRCSRTASARTAASTLPAVLVPYGAPAELPSGAPRVAAARRRQRRPRASAWMSNVVSRRVISNSRRTVGFVHTMAMRPRWRVTRRRPLSSTLSPVESMNSTPVRSSTTAVLPRAMADVQPPAELRRGADVDLAA